MAKQLKNLEIDEISLVDKGANAGAKVLIFKRDSGDDRELVEKCLTAVRKEDVSGLQVADFEGALHSLAQDHADPTGQGYNCGLCRGSRDRGRPKFIHGPDLCGRASSRAQIRR